MAQIEIYVRFKGDKKWHREAQINAASQGAMRLYYALEEKYLPSYDLKKLGYSENIKVQENKEVELSNKNIDN